MASASAVEAKRGAVEVIDTTLLDLVWSVREVTSDDREVVVAVRALLRSGRIRLRGAFRGCPIECLLD
ncbi:MAG TPA: hypothetical protein VMS22_25470 [Candidatus Eisenbacteria bacterium]|nr:hypothetical protein [Candidatus Eisenbacteria bacterium]